MIVESLTVVVSESTEGLADATNALTDNEAASRNFRGEVIGRSGYWMRRVAQPPDGLWVVWLEIECPDKSHGGVSGVGVAYHRRSNVHCQVR